MRFVELQLSPARDRFRLHSRITFLRGLDPAERVAVVGMAHDVALGHPPDWEGVAEIDGVELSLADAVEQMGETAESALIVAACTLPAVAGPGDASQSDATERHAEAAARVEDLEKTVTDLADELAASGRLRSDMKARLASALDRVDNSVGRELDRADGELSRRSRLADSPDPWTGTDHLEARAEELRELLQEFDTQLEALPSGDRAALAVAASTARAALSTGEVSDPAAAALAHSWTSLHHRLARLESRIEGAGGGPESVAVRLEAARSAAHAATDAAVPRAISREEFELIARLHDQVMEADHRTGHGLRRGSAKAEHNRAASDLQDALDSLGYPTWPALRLGDGNALVLPEILAECERATAELEAAEMEWADVTARLEADTELRDARDAIKQARQEAIEILGSDPGGYENGSQKVVADALRAATVVAASLDTDVVTSMEQLRRTLDSVGALGVSEIRADAALLALGDMWLRVLEAADAAAARILRDQERAQVELAALEAVGDTSQGDGLDQERAAVRDAEGAVSKTRTALGDIVRARLELHMLAAAELAVAQDHDEQVTQLETAQLLLDLAAHRLDGGPSRDAAAELAPRVPRGSAGAIPMVVVMGQAPASALDVLTTIPDDIQVIVVGEGAGIDEWIAEVGADLAMSVDIAAVV